MRCQMLASQLVRMILFCALMLGLMTRLAAAGHSDGITGYDAKLHQERAGRDEVPEEVLVCKCSRDTISGWQLFVSILWAARPGDTGVIAGCFTPTRERASTQ